MPFCQQGRQWTGKRTSAFVFQRVNELTERTVVAAIGRSRIFPAPRADGSIERTLEHPMATCTGGRKTGSDQCVAGCLQRSPNRFRFSHNAFRLMPRMAAARV